MDGFEPNEGVIVMAATNMQENLDAALTRPGRFDRHVAVPLPDVRGRLEILNYYLHVRPCCRLHNHCDSGMLVSTIQRELFTRSTGQRSTGKATSMQQDSLSASVVPSALLPIGTCHAPVLDEPEQ